MLGKTGLIEGGTHLTEADRTQRILRWWPECLSALAVLGALYLFWWHLFA